MHKNDILKNRNFDDSNDDFSLTNLTTSTFSDIMTITTLNEKSGNNYYDRNKIYIKPSSLSSSNSRITILALKNYSLE